MNLKLNSLENYILANKITDLLYLTTEKIINFAWFALSF